MTRSDGQLEGPDGRRRVGLIHAALLSALGLLLFFPGLGSFGFWDPYEIRIADAARALHGFSLAPALGHPPALIWIITAGFKTIGTSEFGGRLPIALLALLALLAVYYAGASFVGRRGALIGAFALATCPAFLLGARQLTTSVPVVLAGALAVGGLARAAFADPDSSLARRLLDLFIGLVGLALGQLAVGAMVGLVAPLAAVAIALYAAHRATPFKGLYAVAAAFTAGAVGVAWHHPGYSMLLGGVPHPLSSHTVITTLLQQLGFSIFPWIVLSPMAGMRALQRPPSSEARDGFGRLLLLGWFVLVYLAASLHCAGLEEIALPAEAPVLLLIGAWLDELLDSGAEVPFAALTLLLGAVIIGRDLIDKPEHYVAAHLLQAIRWPGPLRVEPYVFFAYAAFFGGAMALGLGVPLAPRSKPEQHRKGRLVLVGCAFAAALAMALATTQWIVPSISRHLSARELYGRTKQLDPHAPIGQYRFNATGASYYLGGRTPVDLRSVSELFGFLAKPERVFVMVGEEELAPIDQSARERHATYYVVDDTNSRFLVLSNRLGPKEHDLNPLRRFISTVAPAHLLHPAHIVFENKLELIGYDLPARVSRGESFKIRLYFKVDQPIGGFYKVFLHFDGPGERINGDHIPLDGRFPTQYWVPGYYITDEHLVQPERTMEPAGAYQIYVGLFSGNRRMKVVTGPQDGENRAKLGVLVVN